MGCFNSRGETDTDETAIRALENDLNYSDKTIKELDFIHRKYSFKSKINANQWQEISKTLGIPIHKENVKAFYESFLKNTKFDFKEILTLALALGNGSNKRRSRTFFEAFDISTSQILSKKTIQLMFSTLFTVSVEKTAKLTKGHTDEQRIQDYLRRITTGKEDLLADFVKIAIKDKDDCSIQEFIQNFSDNPRNVLLTSSGFREALNRRSKIRKLEI